MIRFYRHFLILACRLVAILLPSAHANGAGISLEFPSERLVFQRDLDGGANIPIRGRCSDTGRIEVRLLAPNDSARSSEWKELGQAARDKSFFGTFRLHEGWYSMELRLIAENGSVTTKRIERIGVGEVFIVVGHSVAQGGDLNLPGAQDDRVNTIPLADEQQRAYEKTGRLEDLPSLKGAKFEDGVKPAPFGHGTYFWAAFGDAVAKKLDVPVLILNAGFGGTSLSQWAKSARGESFDHGFVRSELGMPYVNLKNALKKYAAVLGVRSILSDQGQNDASEENANLVFENYKTMITQARDDVGFKKLTFVINRQTPYLTRKQIRGAQERVIAEVPFCFAGPDYDVLQLEDRPDRIHLGAFGMRKAAEAWAEMIDDTFVKTVEPLQGLTGKAAESCSHRANVN